MRKTTWTKPPRSLYSFLGQFDDEDVELPKELDEWLSFELELDSSPSEHCFKTRTTITDVEAFLKKIIKGWGV